MISINSTEGYELLIILRITNESIIRTLDSMLKSLLLSGDIFAMPEKN